ncbi:unnamed protein product [Lactuca saligna]|uniref:Ubiquitin carboxyl-terminal hydrolase n=1 Tax=Lactuca saligna TaxID=75948 RepID=A0AA35ZC43_LACSI|nr:unnamed protein product [Lactuca saligna]
MTDHNVFVFGSFTEDEIKSLQSTSKQNDVEFMFGSLDSATLRSVGIFKNKPNVTETPKNHQPSNSNPVKKSNNDEIVHASSSSSSSSRTPVAVVNKNGNIHDSSSLFYSNGVQEQEPKNAQLPVSFVPESIGSETYVESFEALNLINPKNNLITASNGLHKAATELLPRGLVNSGNLCFLNSTLQALLACSPFVHLLQELRTRNIPEIGYPTLHAFVEFISGFDMPSDIHSKKKDNILLETGKPFRPIMFESVLNNFSPDMPNSFSGRPRQEDAQEFLSFVMHQMHDELLKLEGEGCNFNGGKVSLVSSVSDEDDDESWETVGPKNKTAITRTQSFIPSKLSEIFGGQLKSVVKARAPETLEGYRASSAGKAELVSASKSVKILELPEIIILHLMRFSYGSQGSTKLLKPIHFPLHLTLNRDLLVLSSPEGRRYELVATITHHGREPWKGHYSADVLHETSGKWLRYDDASVVAISTNKVLHDQAYVLFYRQMY